jgi:ArsR family metal-binding transcriptional regulator
LSQNGPIEPSLIQQHENLNALEIVKLLPQTDCGECGESGCFTFATRLLLGEHEIDDCSELLRNESSARKEDLSKLLQPINLDSNEKQLPSLANLLGL